MSTCQSCKHWDQFCTAEQRPDDFHGEGAGVCRRYPPVFVGFDGVDPSDSDMPWSQPITIESESCGEWAPK